MQVKCTNKRCFHSWNYKGSSKKYISCPSCHFKVMLRKALMGQIKKRAHLLVKTPAKKAIRSPTINEQHKSNVPALPRFIAGEDMLDGKVIPYDKLPKLPE